MLSVKELDTFISYCYNEPYQFCMVDRHKQLICKNFCPLEITTGRGDVYPITDDKKAKKKDKDVKLKEDEYKEGG